LRWLGNWLRSLSVCSIVWWVLGVLLLLLLLLLLLRGMPGLGLYRIGRLSYILLGSVRWPR
jgi:hypothetical protein